MTFDSYNLLLTGYHGLLRLTRLRYGGWLVPLAYVKLSARSNRPFSGKAQQKVACSLREQLPARIRRHGILL